MSFCGQCGAGLVGATRFCGECGQPLSSGSEASAEPTTIPLPDSALVVSFDDDSSTAKRPVAVDSGSRASRRRSGGWRAKAAVAVGAVAMTGVAVLLYRGLTGSDAGADTPDQAVQQLLTAATHRDALAGIAVMNPAETTTLRDVFITTRDRGSDVGLIKSTDDPFAGVSISVDGVRTSSSSLGDGIAKVTLQSGRAFWQVDDAKLAPDVRSAERTGSGVVDTADLVVRGTRNSRRDFIQPFVVTVRRDGRWYVSPEYTAAEYLRTIRGLPLPQFDAAATRDGASSASDAVRALTSAVENSSPAAVANAISPQGVPVAADYLPAINEVMSNPEYLGEEKNSFSAKVSNLELHEEPMGGDLRKVVIDNASATAGLSFTQQDYFYDENTGDGTSQDVTRKVRVRWSVVGGCLLEDRTTTDAGSGQHNSSHRWNSCSLDARGTRVPIRQVFVVAQHGSRGWHVDPLATALEYVRVVAADSTREDLRQMLGLCQGC